MGGGQRPLVIAYSPLAQGLLSGRYDAEHRPTAMRAQLAGVPAREPGAGPACSSTTLTDIAASHDATAAQVALAWVISHPNVVAIPGASTVAQLERNAEAADLELTAEDQHRLIDAADAYRPVGGMARCLRWLGPGPRRPPAQAVAAAGSAAGEQRGRPADLG